MPYNVVQALGIDYELHPRVQGNARLGGWIVLVLAKDEYRLTGRVVQLKPRPDLRRCAFDATTKPAGGTSLGLNFGLS